MNSAENPCSMSAGAITRSSSEAMAARSGPIWKNQMNASGKMATSPVSTMSPMPIHPTMAHSSAHALCAPARSRSCWNTGIMSVTSTYSSTAATVLTTNRALTSASVSAVAPYTPASTISRTNPRTRERIPNNATTAAARATCRMLIPRASSRRGCARP